MNRTIKDATVKRYFYCCVPLGSAIMANNSARSVFTSDSSAIFGGLLRTWSERREFHWRPLASRMSGLPLSRSGTGRAEIRVAQLPLPVKGDEPGLGFFPESEIAVDFIEDRAGAIRDKRVFSGVFGRMRGDDDGWQAAYAREGSQPAHKLAALDCVVNILAVEKCGERVDDDEGERLLLGERRH